MRTRTVSTLLAIMLLLNVAPSAAAQAVGSSSDDGAPATVPPASPLAVDPLNVPQGGGLPEQPPQIAPVALAPGVLAAGNPPLTEHTADGFAGALMWLLEAPLTEGQRQDLQDTVVETWTSGDQAGMSTVLQVAAVSDQLAQLGQSQRIALREQVQPQFVSELRQAGDPFSRWMLGVYDTAHQPIANGNPPLTREVSDANAEVMYFLLQVVAKGDGDASGIKLDQPVLDTWAASLASDYPSYSPEQQAALARMPLFRAAMVEGWSALPADQKAQLRETWRPIAQGFLASASCTSFVGLARNGLVEPTDANRSRYADCAGESDSTAAPPASTTTSSGDWAQGRTLADYKQAGAAAWRQAMAESQARHNTYVGLSNMLMANHVTMMNAINNIGSSPYTYVLR